MDFDLGNFLDEECTLSFTKIDHDLGHKIHYQI